MRFALPEEARQLGVDCDQMQRIDSGSTGIVKESRSV